MSPKLAIGIALAVVGMTLVAVTLAALLAGLPTPSSESQPRP